MFRRNKSPIAAQQEQQPDKRQLHASIKTRKSFSLLTSIFLALSVLFLILAEVGSTANRSVPRSIYFLKLDLSHIIPASVPNAVLINSIARSLGLHDFYQIGLWGFCEGYIDQGVTFCSKPDVNFWFNPVEILSSELLAGASIRLPAQINDILKLIKLASQVMFRFYLSGACLAFVLIFIAPLSVQSRWVALPVSILTFIAALLITAATIITTAMAIIFRNVIGGVAEINIQAAVGDKMFAFIWIASAFSIFAWLIQTGLCCCCTSRRDVKRGRKRGNKSGHADARPIDTRSDEEKRVV